MVTTRHCLRSLIVLCLASVLLMACGGSEERKAKYMEEGKQLFLEGNYEKAHLAFKNVLQIDPKDIESRYQMGEALSKLGEIQKAAGQYMAVIQEDPKHLMSRVRMGQLYLLVKNVDQAEKMAKEASAIDPENVDVLVLTGSVLAAQNHKDAAIAKAEAALQKKPDDISATLLLASLNAGSGKIDEAISMLQQNIKKNPDKTAPRLMLVNLYMQIKAFAKAEETLASIITLEPAQLDHRKRMALFQISNNQLDKAEIVLRGGIKDLPENNQAKLMLIDFLSVKRTPELAMAELMPMIEQKPKDYVFRFKLADLQMAKKQIDKVEATLKEIIDLDKLGPQSLIARNKLARLYVSTKRIDEAKALIKEVLAENSRDADALTMRGEFALAENRLPEAIGDFRSVLVDQPQNVMVLKLLSVAHLRNNDQNLARENMEKIIEIAPKDEPARLDLVNFLLQKGDKDQAFQQVNKLLKVIPNSKKGLEVLFKIYLDQKQWGQAQQVAKQLADAYPKEATGYYLSGLGYQAEGNLEKSIPSFELALEKQPETVEPLTQLVKSYLTLKQSDKALKTLSEVIKKQPKNFVAYNLMGGVYGNDKKFDEAITYYRKAIELKPEWANSYSNLAAINLAQKNKTEAIKTLNTGISNTKGSVALVNDLAMLYHQDGEHEKVMALYEESYKQNPNSMLAINNLASYLSDYAPDNASLERAAKLAEPLVKTNNPDMLDTIGWIAYKQGNYDKAHPLLLKVIEINPNSTAGNYHLGMTYFKQGDKAHAREYLEKAVNKNDNFNGLAEAKETLKLISEGS
ncbi:MAG: tetratricopeptide repeat protein [Methylobacter sp.]|nr:tetratricopeptide repeat protein [Methylobacter sp.]